MVFSRIPFVVFAIALFSGCSEEKSETSISSPESKKSSGSYSSINVSGSLAISDNLKSDGVSSEVVVGQTLELIDEIGQVVGVATTEPAGAFTIAITNGAALALNKEQGTDEETSNPFLVTLKGLFLADENGKDSAIGLQKSLVIDPNQIKVSENGEGIIQTGTHKAQKVGAIHGQITMETGEIPTGTDVYIPGTNYFQKTDGQGRFLLGFLPQGTYSLRADRDGFTSLEWQAVNVERQETTILDPAVLSIATGPKIEVFELKNLNTSTGIATLQLRMKSASRYRISSLQDFGDTIYRPVLATDPEMEVTFGFNPSLKVVTIYLEAADNDGLVAKRSITIDQDPPSHGSIALASGSPIVATRSIDLVLQATGADKMRFGESLSELSTASWLDFKTTHTYELRSAGDGQKSVFVEFADTSLNNLGSDGSLAVNFILDTTAPEDGKILLLPPESPTGAFNTPLAWISELEESVNYEVQVARDEAFTDIIRTMTNPQTSLLISPPLESEGIYHWRVRAVDSANNTTMWSDSTASNKEFTVKVLTKAFHIDKSFDGNHAIDRYFGREVMSLGDLNNDGFPEVAVSVLRSEYVSTGLSCADCGVIKIIDVKNGQILRNISEGLAFNYLYGEALSRCDINNDGVDELVVSAPGKPVIANGITYNNAGAVFVYRLSDGSKLNEYTMIIPPGDPSYSDSDCRLKDNANNCIEFGYPSWPSDLRDVPWGSGRYFGHSLSCLRRTGAADQLIVGEPRFHNGTNRTGRVHIMEPQQSSLASLGSLHGTFDGGNFGSASAFLSSFIFDADNAAPAECPLGPTIAISSPSKAIGGKESMGSVDLFQLSGEDWSHCATIDADASDDAYQRFGARLFSLGDADGNLANDELAVSTAMWNGGVVRIYGGNDGLLLKSLKVGSDDSFSRMGYSVSMMGDFNDDAKADLAISAPAARINGQWSAGIVRIYNWNDIDDDDSNSDGDADSPPFLTIVGKPENYAMTGAAVIPILANPNDVHSKALGLIMSRPARKIKGEWQVGSIATYSELRLAPTLPQRLAGLSSNAQLGYTMEAVPDIDNDGVNDVIFGQIGSRCNGKPWGAVSLFTVLDKKFSFNICSDYSDSSMGKELRYLPRSNTLAFAKKGSLFFSSIWDFLRNFDITNSTHFPSTRTSSEMGWSSSWISQPTQGQNQSTDEILSTDPERWNTSQNQGYVARLSYDWSQSLLCSYRSGFDGAKMGYSAEFIGDIGGDGAEDMAFGAPMLPAGSSQGAVLLVDGSKDIGACRDGDPLTLSESSALILKKIPADDPAIVSALGAPALPGFGALVLPLGDLDGIGDGKQFLFVANTNMHHGTSGVIPQFLILKLDDSLDVAVVKHETGLAGGMLGGTAIKLADIDGDGISELAVSYPGGIGRLGYTGQVIIYSGAKLLTPDLDDDIIQKLYNPDSNPSHFGKAVMYSDITGDGISDFVVTASGYDSDSYQDAGAVYIYQVEPIVE